MESLILPKRIGHYNVNRLLGVGGMGGVFLATDEVLQRDVAIKVLHQQDAEKRERFLMEARSAAALNHPNIVTIYEVGEVKEENAAGLENVPYLAMEYIEGESLEQVMEKRRLSLEEALSFSVQILEGLQAAHERRIIHRDIKPSNLMVTSQGRIKILDFGLSKVIHEKTPEAKLKLKQSLDGVIMGTVGYISPEQALGRNLDARSDIFSFGIVLYEMLTGAHPFPGFNVTETLALIVTQPPEAWPEGLDVPAQLKQITTKCLQKDVNARYSNVEQLLAEIAELRGELFPKETSKTPERVAGEQAAAKPAEQPAETVNEPVKTATRHRTFIVAAALAVTIILLGTFIALYITRENGSDFAGQFKTVQVTTSSGLDIFPSFSPDGRSIAYCADRGKGFEIFIKPLTPGGKEIQLTNDGQQNLQPAWSANGEWIAYHSKGRQGIWIIPALGGTPKQLTDFGSAPAWAPDSKSLAFQSDALVDLSANAFAALPPSTIWTVPLSGGLPTQVTEVGNPEGGHGSPHWSPDGQRITFSSYNRNVSEIWSIALREKRLARIASTQRYNMNPVYAPEGDAIYYCAISQSENYGLWRVPVSVSSGEPVGKHVQLASLPGIIKHLTISLDGRKLAYSTLSVTSNLYAVNVSPDKGEVVGKPQALTSESARNSRPAFSPDGKRLALIKFRPGANPDIWLMDSDGSNAAQLTSEPAEDNLPTWFPTGDRLAFTSNRTGKFSIWAIDVTTGKESELINLEQDIDYPRLSPDGKRVAFNSRAGGSTINIWIADLAGGKPQQLTFDREMMGFPSWSPDGKFISGQVKRGADSHIIIVPSTGGTPEQLTDQPGQSWAGGWSPDGDKIVFSGLRSGFWNIWWVSRSSKETKKLTDYTRQNAYVRYPTWSPKGDQIVYEYAETLGNIWMMETVK